MTRRSEIPVIDLFAGPGGLCEGFSSIFDETGARRFAVKVSVEKDPIAQRTLLLRAVFRKFPKGKVPDCYYDYVRGKINREAFLAHPEIKSAAEHAAKEARCAELGLTPPQQIDGWIREALGGQTDWVLIGGPPCQAYSLVQRPDNSSRGACRPTGHRRTAAVPRSSPSQTHSGTRRPAQHGQGRAHTRQGRARGAGKRRETPV